MGTMMTVVTGKGTEAGTEIAAEIVTGAETVIEAETETEAEIVTDVVIVIEAERQMLNSFIHF